MEDRKPDVCIYHGNCADGFGAAWAVWRRWQGVEFVPGVYGKPPPDVSGKSVLLVDFSYPYETMVSLSFKARRMVVLDHHKTAQAALDGFPKFNVTKSGDYEEALFQCWTNNMPEIMACFDMDKSGARLAWEFASPDLPIPALLEHVEDRDLWRFALPFTREIQAVVFSHPYDFGTWNRLADQLDITPEAMINEGKAIERKHFKDIEELLAQTRRPMVLGGHRIEVANLPYTMSSDAAGTLAEGQPFGACYFDRNDGHRVFSLRSRENGIDVSAIAKAYGGGGHRSAAGFQMPLGWEGDP